MKFLSQTFEYLNHVIFIPTHLDFTKYEHDSKEFEDLRVFKEYSKLLLNEFGSYGWELIDIKTEPSGPSEGLTDCTRTKCLFKRSSHSEFFGTGFGADLISVEKIAKERVAQNRD